MERLVDDGHCARVEYQANPSDLSSDLDPAFIKEFHANLKVITIELAKSKATPKAAGAAATGRGGFSAAGDDARRPSRGVGLGATPGAAAPAAAAARFSPDAVQARITRLVSRAFPREGCLGGGASGHISTCRGSARHALM